jgi:enhancing lycopene biosynthesis protein 2
LPSFAQKLQAFRAAGKPIGLICISPAVGAAALSGINVTIGDDAGTAGAIEAFGGKHTNCATDEICYDAANKIVSCSAYMREDKLSAVAAGIEKLVKKVIELA